MHSVVKSSCDKNDIPDTLKYIYLKLWLMCYTFKAICFFRVYF